MPRKAPSKVPPLTPALPESAAILMREGKIGNKPWRQYFVITDNRRVVIDMAPAALGGWSIHTVRVEGNEAWLGRNRAGIVAFMLETNDGHTSIVEPSTLGSFRAVLLARAEEA